MLAGASLNLEKFNPKNPPPQLDIINETAGMNLTNGNPYADDGIATVVKKMTGMVMTGGFNAVCMDFPSNMYFQESHGETALKDFAKVCHFVNVASQETDPIERMRIISAGLVANCTTLMRHTNGVPPYQDKVGDTLSV